MSNNAQAEKETLAAEAKALGVKGYHLMGIDTLKDAIAAAKSDSEKAAKEKAEEIKKAEEKFEAERVAAEKAEADRLELEKAETTTATQTTWQYHKTEQPRVFQPGDIIPAGWSSDNRKLWNFSDYGVWELNANA